MTQRAVTSAGAPARDRLLEEVAYGPVSGQEVNLVLCQAVHHRPGGEAICKQRVAYPSFRPVLDPALPWRPSAGFLGGPLRHNRS